MILLLPKCLKLFLEIFVLVNERVGDIKGERDREEGKL